MDFNKALFGFIRVAFSIMIALLVLFAGIKICSICYDFGYRVFTIKPGIYTLNTSMTAKDMMVIMSADKSDEEQTQTAEPSDTQ